MMISVNDSLGPVLIFSSVAHKSYHRRRHQKDIERNQGGGRIAPKLALLGSIFGTPGNHLTTSQRLESIETNPGSRDKKDVPRSEPKTSISGQLDVNKTT